MGKVETSSGCHMLALVNTLSIPTVLGELFKLFSFEFLLFIFRYITLTFQYNIMLYFIDIDITLKIIADIFHIYVPNIDFLVLLGPPYRVYTRENVRE